jgi:putative component of toxin-antitoxin plasmid stabilization module
MPATKVILYQEDGVALLLQWLDSINDAKVAAKCLHKIERLQQLGHELRRPEADLLRDGIYELRASFRGIHYRVLYFFAGKNTAVISHGITKERAVPATEIDRAIQHKKNFAKAPERHTYQEA